ncbi:rCG28288, isoform CRA_a [Rattus norvegicus]|uniref:RCG28288, isoform CRA_a n=1 Tax=Rattus norvegicus TaxID=10116 RepID=A6IEK0_RAT|nr:rCG28288, isoform CRA_a [Rattus norvegicus]
MPQKWWQRASCCGQKWWQRAFCCGRGCRDNCDTSAEPRSHVLTQPLNFLLSQ